MSTPAPTGDLATFERDLFQAEGAEHPVLRKGEGPNVIVITEMPGITPQVLGFADRIVDRGMSVTLPDLYGTPGRDPFAESAVKGALYLGRSMLSGCVSRDFTTFALDRTSPIATWLRALARAEHARCGGPGVGAVGMCFSGGFALAMATEPAVIAPVMSQPSMPLGAGKKRRRAVDVSDSDLDRVVGRCSAEGLRVLGYRFNGDPLVPAERFAFLRERLGDAFISVELNQSDGNPVAIESPLITAHHSVLTSSLNDEPGEPTRAAVDEVLDFFTERLLPT